MKILVAHNLYRSASPSGENQVVESEIALLRSRGVDVVPYLRTSDEIADFGLAAKALVPLGPVISRSADRDIEQLIAREQPDVMHVHNTYPLISPHVVRVARAVGVPVVHTVHNHRHVCMKGTYFRDGRVCRDCATHGSPWPGVVHSCYQDSRARSLPMAVSLKVHLPTWRLVDRFLALTPQLAEHLVVDAGVPADRITVRPNTVDDPGAPVMGQPRSGALFVGRLSEEKGVDLLLDTWRADAGRRLPPLTVIGDGPLRPMVQALAATRDDIRMLGALARQDVLEHMGRAALLVLPSTCPEAFPRVVVEAFASGLPVVATALGGLPGIVTPQTGELVSADAAALGAGLTALAERAAVAGAAARDRYLRNYHPDVVMDQLMSVYAEVMGMPPSAQR